MDARILAEGFLHKKFLEIKSPTGQSPTEEDWLKIRREDIDLMIDWLLAFAYAHPDASALLDKVCTEVKKPTVSDRALGAAIREIFAKAK
jgi:hypothetical protein